jgi:hypothetical protein
MNFVGTFCRSWIRASSIVRTAIMLKATQGTNALNARNSIYIFFSLFVITAIMLESLKA